MSSSYRLALSRQPERSRCPAPLNSVPQRVQVFAHQVASATIEPQRQVTVGSGGGGGVSMERTLAAPGDTCAPLP